jgi:hypothetical protein
VNNFSTTVVVAEGKKVKASAFSPHQMVAIFSALVKSGMSFRVRFSQVLGVIHRKGRNRAAVLNSIAVS